MKKLLILIISAVVFVSATTLTAYRMTHSSLRDSLGVPYFDAQSVERITFLMESESSKQEVWGTVDSGIISKVIDFVNSIEIKESPGEKTPLLIGLQINLSTRIDGEYIFHFELSGSDGSTLRTFPHKNVKNNAKGYVITSNTWTNEEWQTILASGERVQ